MEASNLVFTGADYSNTAVETILARIQSASVDSLGNKIWQFVKRGAGSPAEDPKEFESPGIVAFDHADEYPLTATSMVLPTVVTNLTLVCYLFILPTATGAYPDVQSLRRHITKATLLSLQPTAVDLPNGFDLPDQGHFWFDPQDVRVDYSDNVHNRFPNYTVSAPWWAWTIDLKITSNNIP